jgi:ATP-dependent Clp protease ATP-binding subunit ClpC
VPLPEALHSVSAQDVADALGPVAGIPAERIALDQQTATSEAVVAALRTRFASPLADALVDAFGQRRSDARPAGLLAFAPRSTARRQFGQTLAETLFGTPAALVKLDLMRAPWRLVTYPPGRVWFPDDYRLADRLRHRPASVVLLTNADRAAPAGLDLAEHILRTGHLTDERGRRLDLRQAAIIVIAARGTQIDPTLRSLIRSETNL